MITRRAFLPSTAAIFQAARASAAPAADFTLGVASYSLRKFTRSQAIDIIKRLGVRYVCIKEFHLRYADPPEARAAGRKEFEDAGLVIVGGGTISLQKTMTPTSVSTSTTRGIAACP
jgi:hypothetical protein